MADADPEQTIPAAERRRHEAGPPRPAPATRYDLTLRVLAQATPTEVALWLADGQRRAADERLPDRVRTAASEQMAACRALLARPQRAPYSPILLPLEH
jgi:hypothetical protein